MLDLHANRSSHEHQLGQRGSQRQRGLATIPTIVNESGGCRLKGTAGPQSLRVPIRWEVECLWSSIPSWRGETDYREAKWGLAIVASITERDHLVSVDPCRVEESPVVPPMSIDRDGEEAVVGFSMGADSVRGETKQVFSKLSRILLYILPAGRRWGHLVLFH